MIKRGRPGIPYERFVQVWEQLLNEGRATTNTAIDTLGGNKSTIAAFRERYEREKASRALSFIKSVELTEAVHQAIAGIKVKEIDALEKVNVQLKARIDEYLALLKTTEEKLAAAQVDFDEANLTFDVEKLSLERKLAAVHARIDDMAEREEKWMARCNEITEHYNLAKREAAVAEKEVEMLREQIKVTARIEEGVLGANSNN